jgi:hypothetical protein
MSGASVATTPEALSETQVAGGGRNRHEDLGEPAAAADGPGRNAAAVVARGGEL